MLSLVLIVTIVGNVILWSYQMNQVDWEKMQEKIEIIDVSSVNDTWIQNPNEYYLVDSTAWESGSLTNLITADSEYMTFNSHFSGIDLKEFVDNDSSNVDSSTDKGVTSNFTAMQFGPDSIYAELMEFNTASLNVTLINNESLEENWPPVAWSQTGYWNKEGDEVYAGIYSADFDGGVSRTGILTTNSLDSSDANAIYVDFWYRDDGCESTEFLLQYYNGLSWDTITDLGATLSEGVWINYQEKITDNDYLTSDFKIRWYANTNYHDDDFYLDLINVQKETGKNYELDFEVQWLNINPNEENEELCIYAGLMDIENLQIDYWSGSDWENLFNDLNLGWNNVSISNYLESPTFTIRFKGTSELNDIIEDSWNIDVVFLHLWTTEHSTEIEFLGQSNTEEWSQLIWNSDIAWSIGSINVIVQLYNYTSDNYSTSGAGYLTYTSNNLPNIKENKTQSITLESTDFRNETGYWQIKITGISTTDIPFNSEIDWIQITETSFGSLVTFRNEGSLTSHVTSFWVNNSTRHHRYEIETFVSPGETTSQLFKNIILPDEPYITKVSTERGNLSVFSSD